MPLALTYLHPQTVGLIFPDALRCVWLLGDTMMAEKQALVIRLHWFHRILLLLLVIAGKNDIVANLTLHICLLLVLALRNNCFPTLASPAIAIFITLPHIASLSCAP